MKRSIISSAATLCLAMFAATGAEAQVEQRTLARDLLQGDLEARQWAVVRTQALSPENTGLELRTALITALEREGSAHLARYRAGVRGDALPALPDPEFIGAVSRAVARLRDPSAIPALAGALGTGFTVIRALAAFGEAAAPALLDVVTAPDAMNHAVDDALITLRFMVENSDLRPLSAGTLARIRDAAEQRLTVPGRLASTGVTLTWAIDLAVVLDDPGLREIVEAIGTDRGELVARGVTDPELIARTQKWAADRLAGIPPLPRH